MSSLVLRLDDVVLTLLGWEGTLHLHTNAAIVTECRHEIWNEERAPGTEACHFDGRRCSDIGIEVAKPCLVLRNRDAVQIRNAGWLRLAT